MEGIQKRFGPTIALGGVDLEVGAGEVLALVGENGAGKSTLMKVLSGAHAPDEGRMWIEGQPYAPRGPLAARRSGVAMIYQELSLAPHLSVAENILLGMEPRRGPLLDWTRMRRIAREALERVGRPDIPVDARTGSLSIAEQQLVEIGRAVAVGCRVLVFDEPTSSLTKKDIARLFDLIRALKADGHAIVYISHFLEEVKAISDRYTVLRDGQSVGGGRTSEATPESIVAMMVGRDVAELYPRSSRNPGEVLLESVDLIGEHRSRRASLQIRRGEVVGIAGLVGAGRTELMRAIFGLDRIRKGQLRIARWSGPGIPRDRWEQGVGMVSEDRKTEGLALGLSIADNMALARFGHWVWPAAQEREVRKWIEALSIKCASPWQPVGALSGGNQQKVAIGRLLHADVDLLLLDEPTRGIDVGAKALIYKVVDQLATQGKAVLMISSYLPELMGTCDRVAVMCRGTLGLARPVGEVDERQLMMEATGGITEAES